MGIGAVCIALRRYIHSRKYVNTKYPNAAQRDWLEGLLVVYQGVIKVNHPRHDDFSNQRLHCVKRYAKVITEGGVADLFDNTEEESTAVPVENEEEGADPSLVTQELSDNTNEDVARFKKEGNGVDDDNNPAPENIPTPAAKDDKVTYHEWGSRSNICYRQSEGHVNKTPKLFKKVVVRGKASYIYYFIYFLPVEWMKDVLLGMTSKNLEGSPVSWGEMLTYLGLWLLMSSITTGGNKRAYWDNSYPSSFKGDPFRLQSFM